MIFIYFLNISIFYILAKIADNGQWFKYMYYRRSFISMLMNINVFKIFFSITKKRKENFYFLQKVTFR